MRADAQGGKEAMVTSLGAHLCRKSNVHLLPFFDTVGATSGPRGGRLPSSLRVVAGSMESKPGATGCGLGACPSCGLTC